MTEKPRNDKLLKLAEEDDPLYSDVTNEEVPPPMPPPYLQEGNIYSQVTQENSQIAVDQPANGTTPVGGTESAVQEDAYNVLSHDFKSAKVSNFILRLHNYIFGSIYRKLGRKEQRVIYPLTPAWGNLTHTTSLLLPATKKLHALFTITTLQEHMRYLGGIIVVVNLRCTLTKLSG